MPVDAPNCLILIHRVPSASYCHGNHPRHAAPRRKVPRGRPLPATGRKSYWDDEVKGFGIVVMATGHISYVFQYRVRKTLRRMKLDAENIDTARTQAEVLKGMIAAGRLLEQPADPLAERRGAEAIKAGTGTFEKIAEAWKTDADEQEC